jgi:hypothetical protein
VSSAGHCFEDAAPLPDSDLKRIGAPVLIAKLLVTLHLAIEGHNL